ncbi:hypothetical protein M3P21_03065 [Ruegeria sp. 2012CJ41-6]|uniref:Uncharacterized protein n=1 Tax=Ruegeria spongiae TaxID=2942209 RepID=A0ABT0PY32_9RHOB|nr:hypothetical protein [Ruegeria spongiae]MCL6282500.1 hypothetical protein [Ruegeria spongiae]
MNDKNESPDKAGGHARCRSIGGSVWGGKGKFGPQIGLGRETQSLNPQTLNFPAHKPLEDDRPATFNQRPTKTCGEKEEAIHITETANLSTFPRVTIGNQRKREAPDLAAREAANARIAEPEYTQPKARKADGLILRQV